MTNVETVETATVTKKQVAKHYLLNPNGDVTENEEEASGIRYQQIESGEVFDYQLPDAKPGTSLTMCAVFGAKTLATNEASQVRNNPKGAGSAAEQMESIRSRFALLDTGKWVDRTREGVVVDKDAMAEAVVLVLIDEGKITDEQIGDFKARIRQKLEDDAEYLRNTRLHPGASAEYAKLKGRQVKTTDDLISGLGA